MYKTRTDQMGHPGLGLFEYADCRLQPTCQTAVSSSSAVVLLSQPERMELKQLNSMGKDKKITFKFEICRRVLDLSFISPMCRLFDLHSAGLVFLYS